MAGTEGRHPDCACSCCAYCATSSAIHSPVTATGSGGRSDARLWRVKISSPEAGIVPSEPPGLPPPPRDEPPVQQFAGGSGPHRVLRQDQRLAAAVGVGGLCLPHPLYPEPAQLR